MKVITADKSAEREPLEKRFQRFAKALMAVPKKELDRELAKDERKKEKRKKNVTR
jgi:hypothetical protein